MKRAAAVVPLALLLCACPPSTETVIDWGLRNAGLPAPVARCIADGLTDRHRYGALRDLYFALSPRRSTSRAASVAELLPQIRALASPAVYATFAGLGERCAGSR